MRVRLRINNRVQDLEVRPGVTLLGVLRDDLHLTGARYGCGSGACGACMVMVDGVASPSCRLRPEDLSDRSILTIEGLTVNGSLHPVQRAFVDLDAMQCGYCTSGMIMSAVALLGATPRPTEEQIRSAMAPHLCRCGVYGRAIRAVNRASR